MSDFGINISPPGVNAGTADNKDLLLNSDYPFYKIDTQNANGFRTTNLNILTNPPEPSLGNYSFTVLYSYAHNYKYITAIQALFYALVPPAGAIFTQRYFQDSGVIASHGAFDEASLFCYADATNIYIVCRKYLDTFGSANDLSGAFYQITVYSPVEDVGV